MEIFRNQHYLYTVVIGAWLYSNNTYRARGKFYITLVRLILTFARLTYVQRVMFNMNNGFESNRPFSVKRATDSRLFTYADLICRNLCKSPSPIALSCARDGRCNYWIRGEIASGMRASCALFAVPGARLYSLGFNLKRRTDDDEHAVRHGGNNLRSS